MANVLMKCSVSGKFVPTGLDLPAAVFQMMQASDNETQCSDCGQMHPWGEDNVVLDN